MDKLKLSKNIKDIFYGGAGGNRTPVRKPSAESSTYLAYYLNLIKGPLISNRTP